MISHHKKSGLMRITTIFGTSIALAAGVLIGWSFSYQKISHSLSPSTPIQEIPPRLDEDLNNTTTKVNPELTRSKRLLNASRPIEALAILSGLSPNVDLSTPEGKEWLRLLVDVYAATENQEQLIQIYNQFPWTSATNEYAALSVADHLVKHQNIPEYAQVRQQWKGKEKELARWVFLDAQTKLMNNDKQGAAAFLEANHFRGKEETERLVRLAALYLIEDPKRSLDYLSEAVENDPKNPDILTFKASLSEALNDNHIAATDYITAVQYDPDSPYRREQLADFYLRAKQYPQALEILQDALPAPSTDTIWLKTIFWSYLTTPLKDSWKKQDIPQGSLRDFANYIVSLPAGIYWDQRMFDHLPNHQLYLNTRQETFWLQLLSALKNRQEKTALQLLEGNIFQHVSWAPELEKSLKTLIRFRDMAENIKTSPIAFQGEPHIDTPEQFLQMLANLSNISTEQLPAAIPHHLHSFLLSPEAFSIPFLAVGWTEAALQLQIPDKIPDTFPSWIAEAIAKAINQNRSSKDALAFALNQKSTPALSLLIAEIALDNEEPQLAFNKLKELYTKNDDNGERAALLLGQFLLEHGNLADARKAILTQPSLANDVRAREILARIALQEGNLKKAAMIYSGLEKDSSEAKSFLARKAFADKEWKRARELTEALLKEHPKNAALADNLQKIIAEENRRKF
jgi:hypothetical protein